MWSDAKWIWIDGEYGENTWVNFRKTFMINTVPEKASAHIAADTKYWLWINGEPAVFEGGLKRGPSRHGTYYDEIDIARWLRKGENTVAALVWYFGKSGFSHLSSKKGGFLFEAEVSGTVLSSNASWRVMKNPAYISADKNDCPPNFRLPEPNVYYDAAKAAEGWYLPGFDAGEWGYADVVGIPGEGVWGKLTERCIPMFKDYGLREYLNSSEYEGFTPDRDTILEMCLPHNAQITPYLKITAPEGKKICVRSSRFEAEPEAVKSVMGVYYTREGIQEYESVGWISGERISYSIPAGVTILSLKYRETGYDTGFTGNFECNDLFLNSLWQKSLRTLYITMRDSFMDCPDRERAQWWGDVNVEMQMMMYCLDDRARLLYKKGVDAMAQWEAESGYMLTVVPTGTDEFDLPFQNLAGIWGFWHYYEYTGDVEIPRRAYEMSKRYVFGFDLGSDGLVIHKKGSWDWADWGENADIAPMENAWYYMALTACRNMASLLGAFADIPLYDQRLASIRTSYDGRFWRERYYYDWTANGQPDDRANALAALSGLADREKYESLREIILSRENASPYMEKYVLDALCQMGYVSDALKRIKKRYRQMVESPCSTLWEYWDMGGTLNHAWSGGPLVTMSKYVAGIRPLDTAYSTFEIKPEMCDLTQVKCTVPSICGDIRLELERTVSRINMNVTIPKNTTAFVYLPLINNALPKDTGCRFSFCGNYARYVLKEGTYSLKS